METDLQIYDRSRSFLHKMILHFSTTVLLASAVIGFAMPAALAQSISRISLSPASVVTGASTNGTITLAAAAPAGGVTVQLSSNSAIATVPATIAVPAGATTATFPVATSGATSTETPQIMATCDGDSRNVFLTVTATPVLIGMGVSPSSVSNAASSTGKVVLNGPAGPGGVAVALTSDSSFVVVPTNVTVAAGAQQTTFPITTTTPAADGAATLSATAGDTTRTVKLAVTSASALYSVMLRPNVIFAGTSSTGIVKLNGPAPASGAVVSLTSNSASVPATITVPAGAVSATFTVTTTASSNAETTITAACGGVSRTVPLTVTSTPAVARLGISPASVTGGSASTGTVFLNANAQAGGAMVAIASDNPAVSVPPTVTIPAGSQSAAFPIESSAVTTDQVATISTASAGITATSRLTLTATPELSGISLPNPIAGGGPSTGTVTLNGPATSGGAVVTLSSTNGTAAAVPDSVTVPSGSRMATFVVNPSTAAVGTSATITASYGGVSKTAAVVVNSATARTAKSGHKSGPDIKSQVINQGVSRALSRIIHF